jgi:hypothetical protein
MSSLARFIHELREIVRSVVFDLKSITVFLLREFGEIPLAPINPQLGALHVLGVQYRAVLSVER